MKLTECVHADICRFLGEDWPASLTCYGIAMVSRLTPRFTRELQVKKTVGLYGPELGLSRDPRRNQEAVCPTECRRAIAVISESLDCFGRI